MNDSFNNSLQTNPPKKYPINTPPTNEWTIEQLLHWSLDQHHSAAISRTQTYIDTLRSQCDAECEDVMTLHDLALTTMGEGEQQQIGMMKNCDGQVDENIVVVAAAENNDPQRVTNDTNTDTADIVKSSTTTKTQSNNNNNKTTLIIKVQSGPHTQQSFTLHPRPSHPCLIGRSKGKKFLRNGISLSKDQEVSTTHGKFTVERCCVDGNSSNDNNKFYYTDVGSTNGSTVSDVRLEPNVRVEIVEGMEMRIGNSTLKIVFG